MAGIFTSKSSAQAVILKADTVSVPCSSTNVILVPVRLDNFTNVSGLQFTLQWDTARLDYAYVTMLHPQFAGVGFDTSAVSIAGGKLTFAWTDLAGLSLPSDAILFKVAFNRIGGPQAPISFTDNPTAIAVFDNQFNELQFETHNGAIKPIDTEGPTLTCPPSVITGASGPIPIPNISPVVADNCGGPNTGWTSVGATIANFPNDPDASGAFFGVGVSTVTYKTTDVGGNTATCSFDIVIEFSVSTSDLTLIANPNSAASCGDNITIDVLAFNFDSIAGLQFSMDWLPANLEFISISNYNAAINLNASNFNTTQSAAGMLSFAWTSANITGNTLPVGETMFTLTFKVLGGGSIAFGDNPTAALAFTGTVFPPEEVTLVTLDANILVTDNEPPAITCPADITVQAPGATAVQGIAPTSVIDNCAAPNVGWTVSGVTNGSFPNDADASNSLFNLGTSTVVYTATDPGNNTASCSFNVTVEFANTTTDLTIIANSANAACGGNFTVNFTALNFETVAGVQFTLNWDPALYQFTSLSNLNAPIAIDASNFNVTNANTGSITFAWTAADLNGASLNNGDLLFSLNYTLLSNTPSSITFGDNPTLRIAFDGGTFAEIPMSTIDGLVSVVDNVPPTLSCPANVSVDAPAGQLFATVNGLEPTTLTDNCGGNPGLTYTQTGTTTGTGSGNANGNYNAGTTVVTYTATDANGNTATCSFEVLVDAGTPVVLQLDTVDLGCQGAPSQVVVNLTVDNFTDIIGLQFGFHWDPAVLSLVLPVTIQSINAGPPPLFINQAAGTLVFFGGHPAWPSLPNGSPILTLTFDVQNVNALANTGLIFDGPFDAINSGFQAVPVQTINGGFVFTLDNVPPVVTCPSDTVLTAPVGECEVNFMPTPPSAMDACGAIGNISFTPAGNTFLAGTPTTVTFTVSDDSGNTSTCSYTVTVNDITPPQVSGCPVGPILGDANTLCQANVCWTAPSFLDACGPVTVTNDYDPCGLFSLGSALVNYTAVDNSGNVTTCSFEVLVQDMTPPTMICPADTAIVPIDGCSAIVHFDVLVSDFCDQNPSLICSDTSGSVFTGITSVTCAAIDAANNVAQCTFTVTVLDGLPPTFTNGCPADITVNSASGNCGANPTWNTPAASDNCDQNLTIVSVPASGGFLAAQPDPHIITYTATDDLGNTATCTFTVTVVDNTAPVLANCPTLPVLIFLPQDKCDTILNWTPPTVSDNCGLASVVLTTNLPSGSLFSTGDTMVVYTATDASGNSSTCFFNVSVKDVVPPSFINCPTMPFVVNNGNPCGVLVDWTFPLGHDNCTPDNELRYTSTWDTSSIFPIGSTIFPVRVTDASGNFVECVITVTVNGPVPGFVNIPTIAPVTTCQTPVCWVSPTPVGFCPPVTIDSTHASCSIFPFGTTIVTYTAQDTFGNSATATFVVVVSETEPPVIDCPTSPIVVNVGGAVISDPSDFLSSTDTTAGCNGVELNFNLPSATDNCVTPTVLTWQGLTSGSVFPIGFNDLIFRAVDSSGNFSQCAVFVQVVDLPELLPVTDPNPGCLGETVTITAANIPGATYTWTGPVTSSTNVVTINNLSVQNSGVYTVSANVNGCITGPDTAQVVLTLPPTAVNDLDYSINPGETVTFGSVLGNDLLSPLSDFSICDTSALPGLQMNLSDGTFSYTAGETPGMVSFLYTVCSKTCDLNDQAAVTITIKDVNCVFIPNIITPNGDDTNDWFTIPCIDTGLFRENSLVVYNQWGDKVYEASPYDNDPAKAWRGTLNGEAGKDLPDGVYFYIFKPGSNIAPMKGFVEIFR